MSTSTAASSRLFTFFNNLRKAGFPLGIGDYCQLVGVLREVPLGKDGKAELFRLCRLLWLKSERDASDFYHHYRIVFQELSDDLTLPERAKSPEGKDKATQQQTMSKPPPSSEGQLSPPTPSSSDPPPAPEFKEDFITGGGEDPVTNVRIHLQNWDDRRGEVLEKEARKAFGARKDALPVTQRQMTDIWRRLRNTYSPVQLQEMDLQATVRHICKTGFFTEPAWKLSRQHNRLFLLSDHEGSMTAFETLGDRLHYTAQRLSNQRAVQRFYFRNVPEQYVYKDPLHTQAKELFQLLQEANSPADVVMVFSDAGAARGLPDNTDRIGATVAFLDRVRPQVTRLVWINPMPRHRWRRTAASVIAKYVPMFSVEENEIRKALQLLM